MTTVVDPLTALQQPAEGECARKGCTRRAWRWGKTYCQPHARALGLAHHRVNAEPIRAHIQACIDAGATIQGIADDTGASYTSTYKLVRGTSATLRRATAEKLLTATPDMTGLVPILGTRRRLRAWRAAGWTTHEIQDATGIPTWTISEIVSDQCRISTVSRARHQAVAAAFTAETMQVRRAPDPRIARKAWPLPAEWDNPDNPDEDPAVARVAYAEDCRPVIDYIVAHHGDCGTAARAIGTHQSTMYRLADGERAPSPEVRQKLAEHYIHLHGAAA
ncbi:hypothetical protein [Corynebacterium sp.]|uniref:hypothetical protein n=1 Tax=Corynebacterium sp. TaxID=1720 RepID=UPI0028ADED15|nr:hypothetical protein [Corynebacterium sp.]